MGNISDETAEIQSRGKRRILHIFLMHTLTYTHAHTDFQIVYFNLICLLPFADMPVGMPPLTPGTNKRYSEILKASFVSWEKEAQSRNITKGK